MGLLIEAVLTISTLTGYFMVLNGFPFYGAIVAVVANLLWIFYGVYKKSPSLLIVNAAMAVININFITN